MDRILQRKYAKRAKHKRNEVIAKATKLIANPGKYKSNCEFGVESYIKNIKTDKETGEILNI